MLTRIPDPIPWVLTLTDQQPLHCMYRTDAITVYCTVGGGGVVVGVVFLYTGRIRAMVAVRRKHSGIQWCQLRVVTVVVPLYAI